MTKSEAIKQLIADFHNRLIAKDWMDLDDMDIEMCEALKIEIPERVRRMYE